MRLARPASHSALEMAPKTLASVAAPAVQVEQEPVVQERQMSATQKRRIDKGLAETPVDRVRVDGLVRQLLMGCLPSCRASAEARSGCRRRGRDHRVREMERADTRFEWLVRATVAMRNGHAAAGRHCRRIASPQSDAATLRSGCSSCMRTTASIYVEAWRNRSLTFLVTTNRLS